MRLAIAALVLLLTQAPPPLQIVTTHLPAPEAGRAYLARLAATGGAPPYRWSALSPLPPGLQFDPATGVLRGRPLSAAPFTVLVELTDSSATPLRETRLLPSGGGAPLRMHWTRDPAADGSHATGALQVINGSRETLTVTVLAVAVNSVGKAFSLSYGKESLQPDEAMPDLSFDVELPYDSYTVQADAVGEDPDTGHIFRDRLSLPAPLVIGRPIASLAPQGTRRVQAAGAPGGGVGGG